ncbi:hypothetical protein E4U12_006815 [Claviceps purpurea]|nr:hypothetical protein E4U12_006815 [Claviceps purpurea]
MGPSPQPQLRAEKALGHPARMTCLRAGFWMEALATGLKYPVLLALGPQNGVVSTERWHQVLDPRLIRDPITREEGDFIFKWVARKGQQWAEIARQLKGRSENGVKLKNWYNGIQKKMERREKAATTLAAQRPCLTRESRNLTSLPNEGQEERQI